LLLLIAPARHYAPLLVRFVCFFIFGLDSSSDSLDLQFRSAFLLLYHPLSFTPHQHFSHYTIFFLLLPILCLYSYLDQVSRWTIRLWITSSAKSIPFLSLYLSYGESSSTLDVQAKCSWTSSAIIMSCEASGSGSGYGQSGVRGSSASASGNGYRRSRVYCWTD
jgi:hypothetical protein